MPRNETAFSALQNIADELGKFLKAIRPDYEALLAMSGEADVGAELAYLRETVIDQILTQCPEAWSAAQAYSDNNPLREAA